MTRALRYAIAIGLVGGWVAVSARAGGTDAQPEARSPNIVFVLVDDLGYTDVNPYASHPDQYYETPHITRLAGQGMRFTNAYANAANCAPTRAALMSGQYYPNQPIYTVNTGARGDAADRQLIPAATATTLPLEKVTLAEQLQAAGYATAFMGKWHLGDPPEAGPRQQGFDINVGGYRAGHPSWDGRYFAPNNNPAIDDARDGEYLTDYLFRKANEYIRQHRDAPFYLQLAPYAVHTPLQAPDARVAHYDQKAPVHGHNNPTYAAMIESVDRGVGRILETLDTLGLTDNTIVIFTSDNGGLGGYRSIGLEENGITDNAPLKGGKGSFYEGGIRVPFIVRWPGVVRPGTTTDAPVISLDVYPTLLDAAGVEPPSGDGLDGQSLLPVLEEQTASLDRDALYWHFPGYLQAYGPGLWRTAPVSVVRAGPWKLLHFYEDDRLELYHLERDIGETRNLAQERPAKRDELVERLRAWLEATDAPRPQPKE